MRILPYDALDELFSVIDPAILMPIFSALLIVLMGMLLYALLRYLVGALGLYAISKRRGYRRPWLSFIPVANVYLLGAVADNISYCKGKKRHFRYALAVLSAIPFLLGALQGSLSRNLLYDLYAITGQAVPTASLTATLLLLLCGVLLRAVNAIVTWIVLFSIYRDYQESRAVLYLILTILLGLHPFFLFTLRRRPSASLAGFRPET